MCRDPGLLYLMSTGGCQLPYRAGIVSQHQYQHHHPHQHQHQHWPNTPAALAAVGEAAIAPRKPKTTAEKNKGCFRIHVERDVAGGAANIEKGRLRLYKSPTEIDALGVRRTA